MKSWVKINAAPQSQLQVVPEQNSYQEDRPDNCLSNKTRAVFDLIYVKITNWDIMILVQIYAFKKVFRQNFKLILLRSICIWAEFSLLSIAVVLIEKKTLDIP